MFRDEVSKAPTEGLAQAVEELNEAGDVCVWCVALNQQSLTERPLCVSTREGDLVIAVSPFVVGSTLPAATGGGRGGHLLTLASERLEGVVYSGVRQVERISDGDVTLSKLRRHRLASPTFLWRSYTHRHNGRHPCRCRSARW